MTLWNIIRDFFVQYIFGGTASNAVQYSDNLIGGFASTPNMDYDNANRFYIPINGLNGDYDYVVNHIWLADWLSTTATIITLCAICVFLFLFVRWLFRLTAGLVSGRG